MPGSGTVETRVGETSLKVPRSAMLAAYAQALAVSTLPERPRAPAREIYLVNSYNRFEASRYGLRGEMVEPCENRKKRIGDDILDTVATVMPHARRLQCAEALAELAANGRRDYSAASVLPTRRAAARAAVRGGG